VSEAATVLERDSASLAERRARLVAASSLLDEAIARLS
jgi:hypothetical protein